MPRSSAGVPGGLPGPGVAGVRSRHLGLRPVRQRRCLGRLHQLAARLGRRCQRVGRLLPGGPAPSPARRRPRPCCRPTPPGNLLRGPPGTASIGHGQFPLSADNATATPVVSLVRPCLSGPLRSPPSSCSSGSCTSCAARSAGRSVLISVAHAARNAGGHNGWPQAPLPYDASVRDRLPRHRVGLARLLSRVHRRFEAVALASGRLAFYVARRSSTAQRASGSSMSSGSPVSRTRP